ncbi:hypothetical protein V6R97_13315 [Chromohalobacter salexigens]|uniref:hypothetical protein n=1 Tax=Chromohalobacter israelensis TaxID=141390 RepID=UPI0032E89B39
MPSNKAPDRHVIAATSLRLETFLADTIQTYEKRIRSAERDIHTIDRLVLRSEAQEREKALEPTHSQVKACRRRFLNAKRKSGLGWLLSPVQTFQTWRGWRQAQERHTQAASSFDAPVAQAQRATEIDAHNHAVEEQRHRRPALKATLESCRTRHSALIKFQKAAAAPMAAARDEGWLDDDFARHFENIASLAQEGHISDATKLLPKLVFQSRPSTAAYTGWQQEAKDILVDIYRGSIGVPVTGALTDIAQGSAELAVSSMRDAPAREMASCSHPADQWQLLPVLAASPQHFTVDVLWAIYWGMLQCEQKMAEFLADTTAHEDILNGRFSALFEKWLTEWAAKRIPDFGYPSASSYLGTLQLANTSEEARTGADLGVIISLNVGGLRCRKAVLLQAKRAKRGIADVGSTKGQLPKLSRLPCAGYYLFYHESPSTPFPPVPTVSSAGLLQQRLLEMQKDTEARYLPLDVRTNGWDWASFVSFGLCNVQSDIGENFDTIEDALSILGSGSTGELPQYIHVVAIEDEPYVLELKRRLREHYRSMPENKHLRARSRKKRSHDGRELGR